MSHCPNDRRNQTSSPPPTLHDGSRRFRTATCNVSSTDSADSPGSNAAYCAETTPIRVVAVISVLLFLLGLVTVTIRTLTEHQTITVVETR